LRGDFLRGDFLRGDFLKGDFLKGDFLALIHHIYLIFIFFSLFIKL
jgi:hypothetical protein